MADQWETNFHPSEERYMEMTTHNYYQVQRYYLPLQGLTQDSIPKIFTAWTAVVNNHEALRFVYKFQDKKWMRTTEPPSNNYQKYFSVFNVDSQSLVPLLAAVTLQKNIEVADAARNSNLGWHVFIFTTEKSLYFFFCMHHLIHDGFALFSAIFPDFMNALSQQQNSKQIILIPGKNNYQLWVNALKEYSKDLDKMDRSPEFWYQYTREDLFSFDGDINGIGEGRWRCFTRLIDGDEWDATMRKGKEFDCGALSIISLGIILLNQKKYGKSNGLLEFIFNGRKGPSTTEKIDVSKTCGFFSTPTFEYFNIAGKSKYEMLKHVHNVLKNIPNGGYDYRLTPKEYRKQLDSNPHIRVNYFPMNPPGFETPFPNSMEATRCFDFPEPKPSNRLGFYFGRTWFFGIFNENFWSEKAFNELTDQIFESIFELPYLINVDSKL